MPGWIFNWYQVSHFMAMCLPAVYPWVFSGPQLLTAWMDQVSHLYSLDDWMTMISSEPDSGQGDVDTGARGG